MTILYWLLQKPTSVRTFVDKLSLSTHQRNYPSVVWFEKLCKTKKSLMSKSFAEVDKL
jgi:hypothetical protein